MSGPTIQAGGQKVVASGTRASEPTRAGFESPAVHHVEPSRAAHAEGCERSPVGTRGGSTSLHTEPSGPDASGRARAVSRGDAPAQPGQSGGGFTTHAEGVESHPASGVKGDRKSVLPAPSTFLDQRGARKSIEGGERAGELIAPVPAMPESALPARAGLSTQGRCGSVDGHAQRTRSVDGAESPQRRTGSECRRRRGVQETAVEVARHYSVGGNTREPVSNPARTAPLLDRTLAAELATAWTASILRGEA